MRLFDGLVVNKRMRNLKKAAQKFVGSNDYGGYEKQFQSAMKALMTSYRSEGKLTDGGRTAVGGELFAALCTQLGVRKLLSKHPEIERQPVPRPLFIVSFPRTGTTLLHHLLAKDARARIPRYWELVKPFPPPEAATRDNDPRIEEARQSLKLMHQYNPGQAAMHNIDADGPEECFFLLKHTFMSPTWAMHGYVPSYINWLLGADKEPAYRFLKQMLQILQWKCPGEPWILKSPIHLYSLDALIKVFPDARIVMLHRNLEEVMPSMCSLSLTLRAGKSYETDQDKLIEGILSGWGGAMAQTLKVRESIDPSQALDVAYRDLAENPVATSKRIYETLGYECSPEMEAGMKRHIEENPKGKFGKHKYSMEEFNLTPERLDRHFGGYREKFGV